LSNPTTRTVSSPRCTTCVWDRPRRRSPAGSQVASTTEGLVEGIAAGDAESLVRGFEGDAVEAEESSDAVELEGPSAAQPTRDRLTIIPRT
jgi:hypothetical protein